MSDTLIISVDAMGGDHAPMAVIEGVASVARKDPSVFFFLYGDENKILPLTKQFGLASDRFKIHHTTSVVKADDKPSVAIRSGRESSMWKAIYSVRTGESAAVVSAGNTGAFMAMSKICLGTIAGLDRPALAAVMPTSIPKNDVVMLDLGANAECDATNLVEFAIMGSLFYSILYQVEKPRVGLLNIGSEETKGREEIREASSVLKEHGENMDYIGFVEGFDIGAGRAQVVVADGFSGNVALKSIEGTAKMIKRILAQSIKSSWLSWLAIPFLLPALMRVKKRVDPRLYNGALFLGLNGISVKSHGGADAFSYARAVETAIRLAENDLCAKIKTELENAIFAPQETELELS